MVTKVFFARQQRPEKARLLCQLTEDFYGQKSGRILIYLQDVDQAVALDRFLWTWEKGSFLPHVYDSGAVDCHSEPIVITTSETNCNGARILIMGNPCSNSFINGFSLVVDLAEVYDEQLLAASRDRFRHYRDCGFKPEMYPAEPGQ